MTRVVAACLPPSDPVFEQRVRTVMGRHEWQLDSPEGLAVLEAVLRKTYPLATVVTASGVSTPGSRQSIVLDVYRDGGPALRQLHEDWIASVYDGFAGRAYRRASKLLRDDHEAELAVEQAFQEVLRSRTPRMPVEAGGHLLEAVTAQIVDRRVGRDGLGNSDADDVTSHTGTGQGLLAPGAGLSVLPSQQRAAIELAVSENLKVREIGDRLLLDVPGVHRLLKAALMALRSPVPTSAATALARWREAMRVWVRMGPADGLRDAAARDVAHAWVDYQVASRAISSSTVLLVTDTTRRLVAATANAAGVFARPSVIGLRIDDVTPEYGRQILPNLWSAFDEAGGMDGVYDCDRRDQPPLRVPFTGIWGRPLPELQVGYLNPVVARREGAPE